MNKKTKAKDRSSAFALPCYTSSEDHFYDALSYFTTEIYSTRVALRYEFSCIVSTDVAVRTPTLIF
ncbi:MAG TPA: hypothetical protein VIX80_04210, partial [Candidatus Kapabacteria bacterium]